MFDVTILKILGNNRGATFAGCMIMSVMDSVLSFLNVVDSDLRSDDPKVDIVILFCETSLATTT